VTEEHPYHIAEEELEKYEMAGRLSGMDLVRIEDHISLCPLCRDRKEEIAARVSAMRDAQRLLKGRERQRQTED
jgi:hypothetical protein